MVWSSKFSSLAYDGDTPDSSVFYFRSTYNVGFWILALVPLRNVRYSNILYLMPTGGVGLGIQEFSF